MIPTTITSWQVQAQDAINSLGYAKTQLSTQLDAMRVNSDYNESDIEEVEAIIVNINNQISEL